MGIKAKMKSRVAHNLELTGLRIYGIYILFMKF